MILYINKLQKDFELPPEADAFIRSLARSEVDKLLEEGADPQADLIGCCVIQKEYGIRYEAQPVNLYFEWWKTHDIEGGILVGIPEVVLYDEEMPDEILDRYNQVKQQITKQLL